MKNIIKIGLVSISLLLTQTVAAEWYIGAETIENNAIPYLNSLRENTSTKYRQEDDSGISLVGGFRTNKFFSVQVEYQDELAFGIDNMFAGSSLWFPETESANFDSNAVFLSGVSSYPITESASLYMKGGVFNWEIDSRFSDSNNNNSNDLLDRSRGTDVFFGLGANYNLNPRFGISAEWERYQMEEDDVDYLSTELKFKF